MAEVYRANVIPNYKLFKDDAIDPVHLTPKQWTYRTLCDQCKKPCKKPGVVRYWRGMRPVCQPCGETLYEMQELRKIVGE